MDRGLRRVGLTVLPFAPNYKGYFLCERVRDTTKSILDPSLSATSQNSHQALMPKKWKTHARLGKSFETGVSNLNATIVDFPLKVSSPPRLLEENDLDSVNSVEIIVEGVSLNVDVVVTETVVGSGSRTHDKQC